MRRLAASLFGRRDDNKKQRKEADVAQRPLSNAGGPGSHKLRPFYVSPPSNSSASSSTSFSVLTPDEGIPPSLPMSEASRGWKNVFRSRKGSMSSVSLARPQSTRAPGSLGKAHPPSALARSRTLTDTSPRLTDDEDDLSPPVRPFVRHRSSRSSEQSSSNTNSARSSRSSLVPPMPPIPASPPPLTPSVYMQAVIIRSLSRNPYTSPHPLLSMPTSSINVNNPGTSEIIIYPRSVNAPNALPPPILTLPRHLARLRLLERLKFHVFTQAEERAILRASSLFRLSASPVPGVSTPGPRQTPSIQVTAGQQTPQEVEATQIHRVDRSGVSRGLARWVHRGGFEERCVVWTIDDSRGAYVYGPIKGDPVAALEFSEGMEAFAGLVESDDLAVTEPTAATARSSSASSLSPYTLSSTNPLLAASTSISLSARSSSASSAIPSTPALSAAPSSPTPSSISLSLSPAMATSARSVPTSYIAPAPGSTLQRVPSLPKRRGVRFAPSVLSSSPPSSPISSEHPRSPTQQTYRFDNAQSSSSGDRSLGRRNSPSAWGGPVVIVHPSTPAEELEIDAPPPSPGSQSLVSKFGAPGPKQQRASNKHVSSPNPATEFGTVPFAQREGERDREMRERADVERNQLERERRRKSSLTAQQRLHDEVVAARKRRESYRLDGGSTNSRAQATLAADSPSFSYSSTNSSSNSSLGGLKPPPQRRTTTEPSSLGRKGRGQMWDVSVDDKPPSPPASTSSRGPRTSVHSGSIGPTSTPTRPPSLRSIATMHGTGTGSNNGHGTSGQRKASTGNLRTMISSHPSNNGTSVSGSVINGRASPAPGTGNGSSNVAGSGGLPRRRSLAPGDPSLSQTQQHASMVPPQPHESSTSNTRRASIATPAIPPMPMQQMYGMPYGMPMQMSMPMVMVQPVAVPVFVPVNNMNSQNGSVSASRPASLYSPNQQQSYSRSSHSRSRSQHTLPPPEQQQHISPSSSSSSPISYQPASASSHSLLSLSRSQSFSQSHPHHRQSVPPPPPVPQRRRPPPATSNVQS